jgi:uncharacterized protein (TIGR03790 family)
LAESVELARFYMAQRQIPPANLLLIDTVTDEGCDRQTYDQEIAAPVRVFLATRPGISCLVLIYGLPLRIDGVMVPDPAHPKNRQGRDPVASVDSELSLVKVAHYAIEGWLPNPFFTQFLQKKTRFSKGEVLMVARLDGPEPAVVKRLIVDSLAAEKKGLRGRAYFDARWPLPSADTKLNAYRFYDQALHQAAAATAAVLPTSIDDHEELLQPGQAPEAALYCGWYSLGHYVDAFDWQPGAIAYHLASGECTTLKKKGSRVWCKALLEDGVAATLGPVGEPYLEAFPLPQQFFALLLDGDFTLMEAYQLSLPSLSWKMVLIGDPLYQPFRQRGVVP